MQIPPPAPFEVIVVTARESQKVQTRSFVSLVFPRRQGRSVLFFAFRESGSQPQPQTFRSRSKTCALCQHVVITVALSKEQEGRLLIGPQVTNLPHMVAVVGPTGSGKSELGLRIASSFGGEIVGCDSVQLYRHFDIGSSKLPIAQRRGIPHHLIDVLDPSEICSAGDYARRGRIVLRDIAARGRIPVVVGGTGFYLQALLEGLFPGPARNEEMRARLLERERRRTGSLHRILKRLDPGAAGKIHSKDVQKTVRALEIGLLERQPLSQSFGRGRDPLAGFRVIKIGLDPPREELYRATDARLARMFEGGLLDEVRSILESGVSRTAKPFETLGYKQALAAVEGRITAAEALASAQMETRRYAKRQMTWFRRESGVSWLAGFGDNAQVSEAALALVSARVSE